ncbi:MAG: hypothetical protein J6386_23470 [Candidatus Synoicihabitans palmerolidicus]|nr:hypothetical protein [Candidatus Synoicihabitans palmerolidicus]
MPASPKSPPLAAAAAELKETELTAREHLQDATAEINATYRATRLEFRQAAKVRQADLTTLAGSVVNGAAADRLALLAAVDADKAASDSETTTVQALRDECAAIENAKFPPLIVAR